MSKTLSRRRATLVLGSCLGLSGCLGGVTTGSLDQLVFDVEVTKQASEDHPTRLHAELRNDGARTVEFVTGPTIVPRHGGGIGPVLLYPETRIGNNETPETPTDGCWRYTDGLLVVYDEAIVRTVRAIGAYEETYSLYTVGEETECLPAGEYRFTDEVTTPDESASATLVVDVRITADGTVTASGTVIAPGTVADEKSA